MRSTMDKAGRVVVPRAMRDRLRLSDGGEIEIAERDGVVEIRPAAAEVDVVQTAEGPVARPRGTPPTLTDAVVRDTLEQNRR
jgi:AbrB family looped-hinge helix DNA binding protein